MSQKTWEILPFFILRSTGFAYDWLDRLTFTQTAAALDTLLDCEEELAALGEAIQQALYADDNPQTRKQRRRYWDRIQRQRPLTLDASDQALFDEALWGLLPKWTPLLTQCQTLREEAEAVFAQELAQKRRSLRDLAADAAFQEAVWLCSPQMFRHGLQRYLRKWRPHKRNSETRRVERQIVSYLQRFCAKNDTAGFFGPVNYGDFATPNGRSLAGPGHERVQKRQGFIAYWAIQALAQAMAHDPQVRPYLRPYRTAMCRLDEASGQLNIGHKAALPLTPMMQQALAQVNGERTLAQIGHHLGLSLADTLKVLQPLVKVRAVVLTPPIPVTTLDPLTWLIDWVRRLPADCATRQQWCDTLAQFQCWQNQFATSPFAEKRPLLAELEKLLTETTEEAARRSGGQFYADRLMIYEESLGGVSPFSLGPDFAAELTAQLRPVLTLCAAHACDVHQQRQAFGAQLVSALSADGSLPFLRLVSHLHQKNTRFEPAASPWQAAILAQLAAQADATTVSLDTAALPPIDEAALAAMPLLTSPDVMLLARDKAALQAGDFQVILAECHDTFMIWGWSLYFHPERTAVQAAAREMLTRVVGETAVANVLTSKRVKIVPFEYPGPTIEMMTPSEKPAEERIAVVDVNVGVQDGRLRLEAPGWEDLKLYNGELPTLAHSLFALPKVVPPRLTCEGHTPRLTMGKVVLQRERWRAACATLFPGSYQGASLSLMYDFRRAARALKLPRYLFASIKNEPKPIFVDGDNYFLLELLHYLLSDEEEVDLSEMLPTPDQLWLRQDTEAFCAELRLSAGYVPITTAD